MTGNGRRITGREAELGTLRALLAAKTGTFVLEGEPGIGKSEILSALASTPHWTVLRCRPTQSETRLAYAALGDLLAPVDSLDGLPDLQREVLEAALLRSSAVPATTLDARSVGVACSKLWQALAARKESPVLVVIDDAHWLDPASADALTFSFRRLPTRGIVVLAARRPDSTVFDGFDQFLRLGPLGDDAVDSLIMDRSPKMSERLRRHVITLAQGNPLYATELASVETPRQPGRPLNLPPTLEAAIGRRLEGLNPDTLTALRTIALSGRRDYALLDDIDGVKAAIAAEEARVIDTSTGTIVFTHPLFEAAIAQAARPLQRRQAHRLLAHVARSDEERIRHLGLSTEHPDLALSAELGDLAERLAARGALADSAEIAERAVALTPSDSPERWPRLLRTGMHAFDAGHSISAVNLLTEVAEHAPDRAQRFRARISLSTVLYSSGTSIDAVAHAEAALELARTSVEKGEAHGYLARVIYDDFVAAKRHAEAAIALLETCPDADEALLGAIIAAHAGICFNLGEGLNVAAFERAIELEGGARHSDSAFGGLAALLRVADQIDRARSMFLDMLTDAELDADGSLPYALSHLPTIELMAGNWALASDYADRHLEAAQRARQQDQVVQAMYNTAIIAAHRGNLEASRSVGHELLRNSDVWTIRNGCGLLGFVALSDGDLTSAVDFLRRWNDLGDDIGVADPGQRRFQPDYVEALIASGDLSEAGRIITQMERTAAALGRATPLASACRVRALHGAAIGEDRAATLAMAHRSVALFAASPLRFDHARSLLTLGQIHRRYKEKAAARDSLTAAMHIFDTLGAAGFAERTRRELARIGLRTSSGGLSETEGRIASLAANGRTVREVADEMYLSPKTVEANLTRIYRKLAVRNRAELATLLASSR